MDMYDWKERGGGRMLRVTRDEAIQIIKSLTTQMLEGSPNSGRIEFTLVDDTYFSIAVHEKIPEAIKSEPPKLVELKPLDIWEDPLDLP